MLKKLKNSEKLKKFKQKASTAYHKAKNAEIHLKRKKETPVDIVRTEEPVLKNSKNANIINLLCLFSFQYQHRWTKAKQQIIERYCETVDDNNYFTQCRTMENPSYALFDINQARQLFVQIRIAHTETSFDHWAELEPKLLTDILHLLALSSCNQEEIQRECKHLAETFNISESVCNLALQNQQTAQENNQYPYNLANVTV